MSDTHTQVLSKRKRRKQLLFVILLRFSTASIFLLSWFVYIRLVLALSPAMSSSSVYTPPFALSPSIYRPYSPCRTALPIHLVLLLHLPSLFILSSSSTYPIYSICLVLIVIVSPPPHLPRPPYPPTLPIRLVLLVHIPSLFTLSPLPCPSTVSIHLVLLVHLLSLFDSPCPPPRWSILPIYLVLLPCSSTLPIRLVLLLAHLPSLDTTLPFPLHFSAQVKRRREVSSPYLPIQFYFPRARVIVSCDVVYRVPVGVDVLPKDLLQKECIMW